MQRFQDLIDQALCTALICMVVIRHHHYSLSFIVYNDFPVCVDLCSENWDDNFLAQVGQNDETQTASEEAEEVDSDTDDDTPMTMQTYKQAIQSLEDVQQFLCTQEHT